MKYLESTLQSDGDMNEEDAVWMEQLEGCSGPTRQEKDRQCDCSVSYAILDGDSADDWLPREDTESSRDEYV